LFFACWDQFSIQAVLLSSHHIYLLKGQKKEKEGIGKGRKKNNPTYQTPIAGEATTGLRVGWLLLISAVDVSPPLS
jgi:hypothetical protein